MNLKNAIGRGRNHEEVEVNITGIMNIFLILIPFLLLTAVFVRIAVLELTLPSAGRKNTVTTENQRVVLNILAINNDGFQLSSPNMSHRKLNKVNGNYNYNGLISQLAATKQKYPDSQDIIIRPDSEILYDVIIQVMDRCREAGFPNVQLAG
jgi:biopolymer transport protein ExbD